MVTLVETTHPISPYIAQARESTTEVLGGARGYVEEGVSRWIGFERRVERESFHGHAYLSHRPLR